MLNHDNNNDDHAPPQVAPWGWKHGLASEPLLTQFLDTPVYYSYKCMVMMIMQYVNVWL